MFISWPDCKPYQKLLTSSVSMLSFRNFLLVNQEKKRKSSFTQAVRQCSTWGTRLYRFAFHKPRNCFPSLSPKQIFYTEPMQCSFSETIFVLHFWMLYFEHKMTADRVAGVLDHKASLNSLRVGYWNLPYPFSSIVIEFATHALKAFLDPEYLAVWLCLVEGSLGILCAFVSQNKWDGKG